MWLRIDRRGYSFIEVLVVICLLVVVVLGIALPQYRAERLRIIAAQRLVLAQLRLARANAINESGQTPVVVPIPNQPSTSQRPERAGFPTWRMLPVWPSGQVNEL